MLADSPANAKNAVESVSSMRLLDFLPQQLRDVGVMARILSLGHDSRTALIKAVLDIEIVADMLLDRAEGIRDSEQDKILIFDLRIAKLRRCCSKKKVIKGDIFAPTAAASSILIFGNDPST